MLCRKTLNLSRNCGYTKRCHTYKKTIDKEDKYGRITLIDENLIEVIGGLNPVKIDVKEIKAIGEFTTADGPYADDWFLTFITKKNWIEIPMYTDGMTDFLTDLGKIIGADLNAKLRNCADWKTRIMFPAELKEKELYEIENIEPKTFWERIKKGIGIQESIRVFSSDLEQIRE